MKGATNGFSVTNELLIDVVEIAVECRGVIVELAHLTVEIMNICTKNNSGGSAIYCGVVHDNHEKEGCIDNFWKANY